MLVFEVIFLCLTIFECLLLMQKLHNYLTESLKLVAVLMILFTSLISRVQKVLLVEFGFELLFLLLSLESKEKSSFCICLPSSIIILILSVNLDAFMTLVFDIFFNYWYQSLIWRFLLSKKVYLLLFLNNITLPSKMQTSKTKKFFFLIANPINL